MCYKRKEININIVQQVPTVKKIQSFSVHANHSLPIVLSKSTPLALTNALTW